eukprot:340975-Prymnesium_polylepis.1
MAIANAAGGARTQLKRAPTTVAATSAFKDAAGGKLPNGESDPGKPGTDAGKGAVNGDNLLPSVLDGGVSSEEVHDMRRKLDHLTDLVAVSYTHLRAHETLMNL